RFARKRSQRSASVCRTGYLATKNVPTCRGFSLGADLDHVLRHQRRPPAYHCADQLGAQGGQNHHVTNLAIALAEINQKVLVIDGDMRYPRIHDIFQVDNDRGLSDWLKEKSPLGERSGTEIFRETDVPNLFILPSGKVSFSASNLLYSPRLPELIER